MDNQELVKQTLDHIPQAKANAKQIVALVKEGGKVTGYQLSDNTVVEKMQAVNTENMTVKQSLILALVK